MRPNTTTKCFLALTQIYKDINTSKEHYSTLPWGKTFKQQGISSPNLVTKLKKGLLELNLIKIKGNKTYWNKTKTIPNMRLIEEILSKKSHTVLIPSLQELRTLVKYNGILLEGNYSISL